MKEFADDNFKFDENGRKFSKRVENTVGKEEIACLGKGQLQCLTPALRRSLFSSEVMVLAFCSSVWFESRSDLIFLCVFVTDLVHKTEARPGLAI